MRRAQITILVALILILAPAIAAGADFMVGVHWGHRQYVGGGDFWDGYVAGRLYDVYERQSSGEWTKTGAPARVSSAQNDDFSGFNELPALRLTLRMDKFDAILAEVEFMSLDDVRIADGTLRSAGSKFQYNWFFREEANLDVIAVRHMAAYRLSSGDNTFSVGGGLSWFVWSLDSMLDYAEYSATSSSFKVYEIIDSGQWTYEDSGIAIGASVTASYEYKMTDLLRPFVSFTYDYAVATWEPEGITDGPWDRFPSAPFDEGMNANNNRYFVAQHKMQDSYDIDLSAIRVTFGFGFAL